MYDVFFFNDTATTEIYTLSLHDALPIFVPEPANAHPRPGAECTGGHPTSGSRGQRSAGEAQDRKSTRLNSSHANISYAVFCLKKKKTTYLHYTILYSLILIHLSAFSPFI